MRRRQERQTEESKAGSSFKRQSSASSFGNPGTSSIDSSFDE